MKISRSAQRAFSSLTLSLSCASVMTAPRAAEPREETVAQRQQPVIYGTDDREDFFQVDDELWRERAQRSVVAFVFPHQVDYASDGEVTLTSPRENEVYNLCEGESFQEQPAAAHCSGVLIDDDLVLTAGHCLGLATGTVDPDAEATCAGTAFVFGYLLEAPNALGTITADDVYRCRRVVARNFDEDDLEAADYSIIQLDRPTTSGHEPVPLRTDAVEVGDRVTLIGFGARLPAKVDQGGVIQNTTLYDQYFSATTDTFEGASGSPVFDAQGALIAVHTRGNQDWEESGACIRAIVEEAGADEHQYVSTPLNALCDAGWPSSRLCQLEPACEDGICNVGESTEDCESDCPTAICGNNICEGGEAPACQIDCDPYADVSPTWYCPPEYFEDKDGCDCACGARDPDCEMAEQRVLGCGEGELCNAQGRCGTDNPVVTPPAPRGCACGSAPLHGAHWVWFLVGLVVFGRLRRRS